MAMRVSNLRYKIRHLMFDAKMMAMMAI